MVRIITIGSILSGLLLSSIQSVVAADAGDRVAGDKRALAPMQAYVGGWRGVGQRRRGSSRGAWTEKCDWSWRFDDGRAELVATLGDAKYFSALRLQAGDGPGEFVLLAIPSVSDAKVDVVEPRRFAGTLDDGTLVLTADEAPGGEPARISVRLVAGGDRMVVLYEKRLGDVYSRLGEVGSTRVGSSFAKSAASGPECIVTGGLGTIAVEYQGKKYFVCCSGCKELFDEDPAAVIEDYRKRKAEEKAQRDRK